MLLVGTPLAISLANRCFKARRQLPSILAYLFKDICFIEQAWKVQSKGHIRPLIVSFKVMGSPHRAVT